MPVHGIDNGNNKHEVYTTEELLSILQQAINSGSLQGIDPTQTPIVAAVRESHNNSDVTFWSGTEDEFNELTGVTSELVGARIGSDGKLYILTGDTTLSDTVEAARQAALEATEGMKREVISVTLLADGWSNTAPYTQTVAVPGMTDDKDFLAPYLEPTGNESDDLAAQVALSCISGGTTGTDSVTFYCYEEKPTTTITVYMVDKGSKLESSYPIASATNIGMVKVGDGLNVDQAGELSVKGFGTSGYFFASLADMKAYNLAEGDIAQTSGYYMANDGGGAEYVVVSGELTGDDAFTIELDNGLFAKLMPKENRVDIRQLGARSYKGSQKFDIKAYVQKYLSVINDVNQLTLYIPSGIWHCSELELSTNRFHIEGEEAFDLHTAGGTLITSYEDSQDYIFKIGNLTKMTRFFVLKNIVFTTAEFSISNNVISQSSIKSITTCIDMMHAAFGITDNLFFADINGRALKISTSFEIYFKLLNFRNINAFGTSILCFGTKIDGLISHPNISACNFEKLMFEQTLGDLIEFETSCRFVNNHFGVINYEDNAISRSGVTQTAFTSDNIATFENSNPLHWGIFKFDQSGEMRGIVVDSLEINNMSARFSTISEVNYALDHIFSVQGDYSFVDVVVANIALAGMSKDSCILYSHISAPYALSNFRVGNVTNTSEYDLKFDVENFTRIDCDSRIRGITNSILPELPDSLTPAYKLAVNRSATPGRVLTSDDSAQNKLKVCVKCNASNTGVCFVLASTTLKIMAKIPDGATPTITISGTRYAATQLTGTGEFKVYELNLHASSAIGDKVQLGQSGSSSGEDILIDYIIN